MHDCLTIYIRTKLKDGNTFINECCFSLGFIMIMLSSKMSTSIYYALFSHVGSVMLMNIYFKFGICLML